MSRETKQPTNWCKAYQEECTAHQKVLQPQPQPTEQRSKDLFSLKKKQIRRPLWTEQARNQKGSLTGSNLKRGWWDGLLRYLWMPKNLVLRTHNHWEQVVRPLDTPNSAVIRFVSGTETFIQHAGEKEQRIVNCVFVGRSHNQWTTLTTRICLLILLWNKRNSLEERCLTTVK